MIRKITVETRRQGLHDITREIEGIVADAKIDEGLCTIFVCHTSASVIIQENADPSARNDLEEWLNRTIPENDPHYTHKFEGSDDMPSHIKAAITGTSLSIPVMDGAMVLGTWQGIYLWEHRRSRHSRDIVVHVG